MIHIGAHPLMGSEDFFVKLFPQPISPHRSREDARWRRELGLGLPSGGSKVTPWLALI